MANIRKVVLYIATSLDGYIAKPNDDLSFLAIVQQQGEDYGYTDFINSVDTIILGRKTYDWIKTQAADYIHSDKQTFVITRTPRPAEGNVTFYADDLKDLIESLKKTEGETIFIDGGAEIVNQLLIEDLIDEFIISMVPILVGDGIKLFKDGRPQQKLKLIQSTQFAKGLVQLHYIRIR